MRYITKLKNNSGTILQGLAEIHLSFDWKLLIKIPVIIWTLLSLFPVAISFIRATGITLLFAVTNMDDLKGLSEYDIAIIWVIFAMNVLAHVVGLWWFLKAFDAREWWKKILSPLALFSPLLVVILFVIVLRISQYTPLHLWNAYVYVTGGPPSMYLPR